MEFAWENQRKFWTSTCGIRACKLQIAYGQAGMITIRGSSTLPDDPDSGSLRAVAAKALSPALRHRRHYSRKYPPSHFSGIFAWS